MRPGERGKIGLLSLFSLRSSEEHDVIPEKEKERTLFCGFRGGDLAASTSILGGVPSLR